MNFCRIFWENRLGQFLFVKLDSALKMTHFHVYIECSNIESLPSFEGHNIRKTRPNRISPTQPVGLLEMLNHSVGNEEQGAIKLFKIIGLFCHGPVVRR